MLGHRLIDVENARLIRAADLELAKDGGDWVLAGVATGRRSRRRFGLLGPQLQADVVVRDWHDFEWLIGHVGSAVLRSPFARIRKLKPAQIADLLDARTDQEIAGVLARVRESALLQPAALTSVHAVDEDGGLRGVARLVTLVQAEPVPA